MAERARPGGPATAGDQLADVSVRLEILLAVTQHLLQPGFVLPNRAIVGRRGELRIEQRPERPLAVGPSLVCHAAIDKAGLAFFRDQSGLLQQAQVPGDAGLRHPEDAGQFADVETVLCEYAEQAQSGAVSKELEKA